MKCMSQNWLANKGFASHFVTFWLCKLKTGCNRSTISNGKSQCLLIVLVIYLFSRVLTIRISPLKGTDMHGFHKNPWETSLTYGVRCKIFESLVLFLWPQKNQVVSRKSATALEALKVLFLRLKRFISFSLFKRSWTEETKGRKNA